MDGARTAATRARQSRRDLAVRRALTRLVERREVDRHRSLPYTSGQVRSSHSQPSEEGTGWPTLRGTQSASPGSSSTTPAKSFVIQRRDNGHWEPPGGVLELGEQFEDGVSREVREETGVNIKIERLTGVYKNLNAGVVALVFRCHPLDAPDTDSAEAVAVRWADPAEIIDLMDPAYAVRVTDAFGDATVTRAHDGVHLLIPNS